MWKLVTVPKLIRMRYPRRIWSVPGRSKEVFLTFDDGPIPEVTPWVLQQLKKYDAKATFFCIGDNAQKHPDLLQLLEQEGHLIANHTQRHPNGWKLGNERYLKDIADCENTFAANKVHAAKLFRPPYGKMTSRQARAAISRGYTIVMWSLLSYDFDVEVSKEQCTQNVIKNLRPGSIVVFHDSLKAKEKLQYVLPRVLEHLKKARWTAQPIPVLIDTKV